MNNFLKICKIVLILFSVFYWAWMTWFVLDMREDVDTVIEIMFIDHFGVPYEVWETLSYDTTDICTAFFWSDSAYNLGTPTNEWNVKEFHFNKTVTVFVDSGEVITCISGDEKDTCRMTYEGGWKHPPDSFFENLYIDPHGDTLETE